MVFLKLILLATCLFITNGSVVPIRPTNSPPTDLLLPVRTHKNKIPAHASSSLQAASLVSNHARNIHSNQSLPARCSNDQILRKCSSFEGMHGGISLQPVADPNTCLPCYCHGKGPNTRKFTLVITKDNIPNILIPGATKTVVQANGSVPGPAIIVDEFDWIDVHVFNHMTDDDVVIHWHGMIMKGTEYSDGVPALTQCTIPPGADVHYHFRATLSGTFWWHGHYLGQYVDGLFGPLIINRLSRSGQTEAEALGYTSDFNLMIQDYYNNDAQYLITDYYLTPNSSGNEPVPDAIVVNGRLSGQLSLPVSRNETSRIRFTAANALSMFNISIDGVQMDVIETDGTSTVRTPVSSFTLNVAQRVSVLVDWSSVPLNVSAVYIRITAIASMFSVDIDGYVPWYDLPGAKPLNPNFLGIVQFEQGELISPNYHHPPPSPAAPGPSDFNLMSALPVDRKYAPDPTHFMYSEIDFDTGADEVNHASFNGISSVPTGKPALFTYSAPGSEALLESFNMSSADLSPVPTNLTSIYYNAEGQYEIPYMAVVDVLINNTDTGDHPIHKHSHPFWLIATSEWPEAAVINRANYPRRDVVTVPAGGWARIRYIADIPGVWAFHCHIDWHMVAGLFSTLVEAPDKLRERGLQVPYDFLKLCPKM